MLKDPSAPGAAPMAFLCEEIHSVEAFDLKHKNVYRYVHTVWWVFFEDKNFHKLAFPRFLRGKFLPIEK